MSRGATRRQGPAATKRASGAEGGASKQGAIQAKTSWKSKRQSYFVHHKISFVDAFTRLLATPVQTIMTSMVVAIALALPSGLFATLGNLAQLGSAWDSSPKISVYLAKDVRPAQIDKIVVAVRALAGVGHVTILTADQALAEFKTLSGFGEALTELERNPLPTTLIVSPAANAMAPEQLQLLQASLSRVSQVDEVSLDLAWVKKLSEIMALAKRIVVGLGALLSLGVLLAIGNTIRLAIENRRDEIIVTKLVGGTNAFVSRPFLYTGAWFGLFGGLAAWLIVMLGFGLLQGPIARLAQLYQSDFHFASLGLVGSLVLVGLSTLLGWLGARIAVSRHLIAIEPK